jgi:hypothetical protein
MERYDGKTRQDDIKKWTLIAIPIVVAIVACLIGMRALKKATAPDYTIVTLCNGSINEDAKAIIEDAAAQVVGDKNGNGKIKISFKEVMPATFGGYDVSASALFTGDYVLFLIIDPSPWSSDILAEKIDLSGTKFWTELNTALPVYGCILNTKEKDMEEARKIIEALQDQALD